MAPPPLADINHQNGRDAKPYQHADTEMGNSPGDESLLAANFHQRQQYYKRLFGKTLLPIQQIDKPSLAADYPELADEIVDAYLLHTTFEVKVWVNYDSASKKFYIDSRAEDCGKIVMSRKQYKVLRHVVKPHIEMSRIRLQIGTPFATLFELDVRVIPSKFDLPTQIKAEIFDFTSKHNLLLGLVQDVFDRLENTYLERGTKGLHLSDVEAIAAMLHRRPTPAEFDRKRRNASDRTWMDLDGWDLNTGRVNIKNMAGDSETGDKDDSVSDLWRW